jgi:hypothetical protein
MNKWEQNLGEDFYFIVLIACLIAGASSVFVGNVAGAVFFGLMLQILTR